MTERTPDPEEHHRAKESNTGLAPVTGRQSPAEPLYRAIKNDVIDSIARGDLKPGDRIETEAQLAARFGASRMTVNRALRELQTAGLITRQPGSGSFVARPPPRGHIIEIRNIAEEVRSRGHDYSAAVHLNATEAASDRTARLLDTEVGTPIFHSLVVHKEQGRPIQLEERFVLASAAPGYGEVDFTRVTPNEYLMQVAPLARFEHRVRALMPDPRTRALLEMSADEPILLLVRRTWTRAALVSHALLSHPASRYEFTDSFAIDEERLE